LLFTYQYETSAVASFFHVVSLWLSNFLFKIQLVAHAQLLKLASSFSVQIPKPNAVHSTYTKESAVFFSLFSFTGHYTCYKQNCHQKSKPK
jgi:hypothetical protein